jgi:hypothetical protein
MLNRLLLITIFFALQLKINAQSIALRFAYGTKNVYSKMIETKNLDPDFLPITKGRIYSVIYGAEVMFQKYSIEFGYTNQDILFGSSISHENKLIRFTNRNIFYFGQIQILYNKFFDLGKNSKKFNIVPIGSIGLSMGFNRLQFQYDDANRQNRTYVYSFDSTSYIFANPIDKRLNNIAVGLLFRVGFALKNNNVERARLQLTYNPGLNLIAQRDFLYTHDTKKYTGMAQSKGTQTSVTLSVPIYLKRKK